MKAKKHLRRTNRDEPAVLASAAFSTRVALLTVPPTPSREVN